MRFKNSFDINELFVQTFNEIENKQINECIRTSEFVSKKLRDQSSKRINK